MILGILDKDRQADQYQMDLLRAATSIPGRAMYMPVVWSNKHLAVCWAPDKVATLDEYPQPFLSCDNTVVVMSQGKIHNVEELKAHLGSGCRFRTGCSGEALAHLYEKSPDHFLDRVNGKFAFALWDEKNEKLVLGRDHFGVEPLFYFRDEKRLIFSSSLRAILATGLVDKQLNHEAVLQYLLYCYNPGAETLLKNIHSLPPGHILSANGSTVSIRRYWQLSFAEDREKTVDQHCDEIVDRIQQAIRIRLEPGRPPGIFLSGGTDSSTIASLSSKLYGGVIPSFSFRCEGRSYDESVYARFMADKLGTRHTEIPYDPERLSLISGAVEGMDEPFCDQGIEIGTYLLGQAARGVVSYVFSGEGGDELFGGHPVYVADKFASAVDWVPGGILKLLARKFARIPDSDQKKNLQVKIKRFSYSLAFPPELLSHRWRIYYTPQELQALCSGNFLESCDLNKIFDVIQGINSEAGGKDQLSRSLHSDFHTLVGFYLRRLGLLRSLSVESRLPLLDYRLVEYAATIPSRLKIRGLSDTKFIYKRALERVLPKEILYDRPKLGHSIPMKNWMRTDGKTRTWIEEVLREESPEVNGFFRADFIERMLGEHQSRSQNHSHRLWALLVLKLWLKSLAA